MPGHSYTSGNLYDNYKFTGRACPDSFFGERDDEFDLTLDYTSPSTDAMQAHVRSCDRKVFECGSNF